MIQEVLDEMLEKHRLWLEDDPRGVRINLSEADLRDFCLDRSELSEGEFRGTNFKNVSLRGANLRNANLRLAYFGGADLTSVDLRGANLRGASFRDANLRGADLRDADLSCVDWEGADLYWVDMNRRYFDILIDFKKRFGFKTTNKAIDNYFNYEGE